MSKNGPAAKAGMLMRSCDRGPRFLSAAGRALALSAAAVLFCAVVSPVRALVPDNVRFTAAHISSAALAWTLDTPGTEQPLMVISTASDFSVSFSSAVGALSAGTTVYHGLTPNATYFFKVKVSTEPDSAYSAYVSTITGPEQPGTPSVEAVHISSVSVSWSSNGNASGSVYFAEAAQDEGFTAAVVSTLTAGTAYTFEGLVRNSTYYMRARTMGFSGVVSAPASFGSTITLSAPPVSPAFASVGSTCAALSWGENGNLAGTSYHVRVSSDGFSTVQYSSSAAGPEFTACGLVPDTTYYFQTASLNSAGMTSGYAVFSPTSTRAAVPQPHPASTFPGGEADPADTVNIRWLQNGNPSWTEYYLNVSTAPDFTGYDFGPAAWSYWGAVISVTSLNSDATYYFQVKARDSLLRETDWLYLSTRATSSGPDTVPPAVEDHESDPDKWSGSSSGFYDVDFTDHLGTGLSLFQVKLSTSPDLAGTPLIDWTDAVTLGSPQEYRDNWPLPDAAFQTITEGVTAYVSVRVYDSASPPNVTVSTDVFIVNRDTTPPVITNGASSPSGWLLSDPGVFDVDFADPRSGLASVQYSASGQAGTANAAVIAWTDIDTLVSSPSYSSDWGVAFASLAGGASNYISVRATDRAGNTATLADAFRILKAAGSPGISVISPSSGSFISTASLVYGSATGGNDGISVDRVEVRLEDLAGGQYYDGASGTFTAGPAAWLLASGEESWTLDITTFGLVNLSSYSVSARAYDSLARYSLTYSTAIFTLDQDPPSVHLSSPASLSTVYSLDAVSGTAADTGSGPNLAGVSVKRVLDGKWWNFSAGAWGTAQVSSAVAVSGGNWTFLPDEYLRGDIMHGATYFITAEASDKAVPANSSGFVAAGSSFTFADTVPPGQITSVSASSGALPGRVEVSWTASGDDGASVVLGFGKFAIKYSTYSGFAYSTASAQVLQTTASVAPGSARSYLVYDKDDMLPSTTYYMRLWVMDDAGLWSSASPEFSGPSGDNLPDEIAGHVKTSIGEGITGVLVEGFSSLGGVWSGFTVDDDNGSFRLTNLEAGVYRIQVTWTADGIASSVAKDLIPVGYADTDFTLSIGYALASVSGVLSASVHGPRAGASSGGGVVDLYQNGRRIASADVKSDGAFRIGNILPGDYELRAPGMSAIPVTLRSGEDLVVRPSGVSIVGESLYAYPNPARTRVTFRLQTAEPVVKEVITVFDAGGRLVKRLYAGGPGWTALPSPPYISLAAWDFTPLEPASGVYIYKANMKVVSTGENIVKTGKFAVIR